MRQCSKHLTCSTLNFCHHPRRYLLLLTSFYRRRNRTGDDSVACPSAVRFRFAHVCTTPDDGCQLHSHELNQITPFKQGRILIFQRRGWPGKPEAAVSGRDSGFSDQRSLPLTSCQGSSRVVPLNLQPTQDSLGRILIQKVWVGGTWELRFLTSSQDVDTAGSWTT